MRSTEALGTPDDPDPADAEPGAGDGPVGEDVPADAAERGAAVGVDAPFDAPPAGDAPVGAGRLPAGFGAIRSAFGSAVPALLSGGAWAMSSGPLWIAAVDGTPAG